MQGLCASLFVLHVVVIPLTVPRSWLRLSINRKNSGPLSGISYITTEEYSITIELTVGQVFAQGRNLGKRGQKEGVKVTNKGPQDREGENKLIKKWEGKKKKKESARRKEGGKETTKEINKGKWEKKENNYVEIDKECCGQKEGNELVNLRRKLIIRKNKLRNESGQKERCKKINRRQRDGNTRTKAAKTRRC